LASSKVGIIPYIENMELKKKMSHENITRNAFNP
jgi:hypothetical protein